MYQQTWDIFLNLLISFFLLYPEFPFSCSTFVFSLHLAWIYNIRNLTYEAHCFLTTLKDDNLHYQVSRSNWRTVAQGWQIKKKQLKTVPNLTSNNSQNSAKNSQPSGNVCIFNKTLIFSLEISRLLLLYLSPCILSESI